MKECNYAYWDTSGAPAYTGVSGFSRILIILFVLFNFSLIYGQVSPNSENIGLSVTGDAKIFSADESFNQQIKKKTFFANSVISDKESGRNYIVIVSRQISKKSNSDLASQVKDAEARKKSDQLKKVQKFIADYQFKSNKIADDIKNDTASTHFSKTQKTAQHYLNERSHHPDQNKFVADEIQKIVLRALDYLHARKYLAYNNRSFDFCYSKVFSVRPPPVKV